MKKCPFCAEEIQDEAIKCRHCGSMLTVTASPAGAKEAPVAGPSKAPVAPTKGTTGRLGLVLMAIVAVIILWAMYWVTSSVQSIADRAPKKEPELRPLNISGGRGDLVVLVTNREDSVLRDCLLSITDREKTVWVANVPYDVAPLQTISVYWSDFVAANGQRMPNYLKERSVIVRCDVVGLKQRLGAGLR